MRRVNVGVGRSSSTLGVRRTNIAAALNVSSTSTRGSYHHVQAVEHLNDYCVHYEAGQIKKEA